MPKSADVIVSYCRRCNKLQRDGVHRRYYCPKCHEVTCGMKRHGIFIVLPHYRGDPSFPVAIATSCCPGGEVDEKEDRAP